MSLSMKKIIVAKVISEFKFILGVKIFSEKKPLEAVKLLDHLPNHCWVSQMVLYFSLLPVVCLVLN